MLETLQTDEGTDGGTSAVIQPNQLIIDAEYCDVVRKFINGAKTEILICAYAWRWYENNPEIPIQRLNCALVDARNRGVKIKVLAETQIMRDRMRALGAEVRGVEKNRMMHTKAFCIDHRTLVLGSHNLTKRATSQNYEMSIMTQEFQVVDSFCRYYETIWSSRG